jgi:hypothetical protein
MPHPNREGSKVNLNTPAMRPGVTKSKGVGGSGTTKIDSPAWENPYTSPNKGPWNESSPKIQSPGSTIAKK